MKIANFSKLLLLAVVLSFSVTACHKNLKGPTPIYGNASRVPTDNSKPSGPENAGPILPADSSTRSTPLPTTSSGVTMGGNDISNYDQNREAFKQDTIHFDFDRYNVKPGELSKAKAVADFLKGQPGDAVLVEGHCDERGTPGYNMALGERRADSVRESLISQGISAERIHTISYGEQKPMDPAHDEAAWAKNRRSEFVLLTPKAGATTSQGQ